MCLNILTGSQTRLSQTPPSLGARLDLHTSLSSPGARTWHLGWSQSVRMACVLRPLASPGGFSKNANLATSRFSQVAHTRTDGSPAIPVVGLITKFPQRYPQGCSASARKAETQELHRNHSAPSTLVDPCLLLLYMWHVYWNHRTVDGISSGVLVWCMCQVGEQGLWAWSLVT